MILKPSGPWAEAPLGRIAKIDRAIVQPDEIAAGTTFVGLEHIEEGGARIWPVQVLAGELASAKFRFDARHILYGKLRPYLAKIARPNFGGICSTDILPILPGDRIDRDYLYHYLHQPQLIANAASRATGANLPRLPPDALAEVPIQFPAIPDQRNIAALLDKADAIRRKRHESRDLLTALVESVFLETIGDPVSNPKNWPIHPLGEHISFITSGSRGWAKYYAASGVRFIRSLDVQMNRIPEHDAVYVNAPPGAEADRTRVKPGDVLLTITGSRIGRVSAVPADVGEAYISQHVAIIRLDDQLRPRFASIFLSLPSGGQAQIAKVQYGQTKPGLNLDQIRNFRIPYPPIEMQDRFLKTWDKLEITTDHQQRALSAADDLFNSLVQRAFSGELV